jgi:Family of unknown function (DUF6252)
MKNKKFILLLLLTPLFMNLKCKKEETPEGYFFMCKLDGSEYRASGGLCVNCLYATLLNNDSLLVVSGSRSIDDISIGILDVEGIKQASYVLNNIIGRRGTYDNGIAVDDRFFTDSLRTGELKITRLDKSKREVEGTFYFKSYNPIQDKIVTITDGKFRLYLR